MILELINDFLLTFTDIKQEVIFQGYQNCIAMPPNNDGFCVMSIMEIKRHGTNVESNSENERSIKKLISYGIDIDFIGDDDLKQRELASRVEALCWSDHIGAFFKERNASMPYSAGVQDVPYLDEDKHFLHRYRIRLYVTTWEEISVNETTAKEVVINHSIHGKKSDGTGDTDTDKSYKTGIENIDAHHKGGT